MGWIKPFGPFFSTHKYTILSYLPINSKGIGRHVEDDIDSMCSITGIIFSLEGPVK